MGNGASAFGSVLEGLEVRKEAADTVVGRAESREG